MVGTSKILTVSYGTFSCTLEGFDDPFSAMKSIAEYFRDLAAEDRFFGAEPPTPDAEMLQRIAEREVNRRVIARVGESGVALRQVDEGDDVADSARPAEPAAGAQAPEPAPRRKDHSAARARALAADAPAAAPAQDSRPAAAPDAGPAAEVLAAPPPRPPVEDFAARMLRIRAEAARSSAGDAFFEDQTAERALKFKPIASAFADAVPPAAAPPAAPAATPSAAEAARRGAVAAAAGGGDSPEAEFGPPAHDADFGEPVAGYAASAPAPEPRAAAAGEESDGRAAAPGVAAATADAGVAAGPAETASPAAGAHLPVDDQGAQEAAVAPADEALALLIQRLSEDRPLPSRETEVSMTEAEIMAPGDGDPAADNAQPVRLVRARVVKMRKSEYDRTVEEPAPAPRDVLAGLPPMPVLAGTGATAGGRREPQEAGPPVLAGEPALPPAAEPMAWQAADHPVPGVHASAETAGDGPGQAAVGTEAGGEQDGDEDGLSLFSEDEDDGGPLPPPASSLADEDEADLLAELAAVDGADDAAPAHPGADPDHASSDTPLPGAAPAGRRSRLERRNGDSDLAVTRILKETNVQLDDTEASRRRSTIAHLKAAVAATRADRDEGLAEGGDDDGELGRYRDDLQQAVRPRRPISTPLPRRLAPLMLVSEQRIDLPKEAPLPDAAVRPRRITAGNLALIDDEDHDDESDTETIDDATPFADYARRVGATALPDLVEAAAAYAAYVEGRPHISRPLLMKRAMAAAGGEASREEGLRAFGTLLRTGRIQKLKRGQFTIARGSRFRPD